MNEALIVGLILAMLWFIEKLAGTPMVIRPIVVAPLVGACLGDVTTGLAAGATLELVFMGAIQIGGAVPPDAFVGSALGTAFAIMNGSGVDVALALALPIAIVTQSLKVVVFIIRSWFMDLAMNLAHEANFKGLFWLNIAGLILQCVMYFLIAFLAIQLGSSAVEGIISAIPESVMNGLKVAGGLLPAVGFALLLQPMITNKNTIYFIMGFAAFAYLSLPILAITIFAVVLAYVICFEKNEGAVVVASEEEGLFDE